MAIDLPIASGPLTATEEHDSLLARGRLDGEVEKPISGQGVRDLDAWAGPRLDELVAEQFHPAMAARPDQVCAVTSNR